MATQPAALPLDAASAATRATPVTTPTDTAPAGTATHAAPPPDEESGTRERVLRLVVEEGPVSVLELARDLDLTPAGVRRHIVALEEEGRVTVHDAAVPGAPQRGRPARRWVATSRGQAALATSYADLAEALLDHLAAIGGPEAVRAFATRRADELGARLDVDPAADLRERVGELATALGSEGYAATVRPAPGTAAVQLCQGHCPIRDVAARYPQLCEAETALFSEVLGVHVQRLATLAAGDHVCTTHVPLAAVGMPGPTPDSAARPTTTRSTARSTAPGATRADTAPAAT